MTVKSTPAAIAAIALAGLALLGIIVLAVLGKSQPEILATVAIGALTGGAGIATSFAGSTTSDTAGQRVADALSSLEQLAADVRGVVTKAPAAPAPRVPVTEVAPTAGAVA